MSEFKECKNETTRGQGEIIRGFVKESCVLGKDNRVRGVDLHNKYIEYCKEKDIKPLELIQFYKELDGVCGKEIIKSRWFEGQKRIRGFDGINIK